MTAPRSAPDAKPKSPHASRGMFTLVLALSAVLAAFGALSAALGMTGLGVMYAALGLLGCWYGLYGMRIGVAVQLLNTSLDRIGQGRFAQAEELLAELDARFRYAVIRRIAHVQRALIAMRRGDAPRGIEEAGAAIALPIGLIARIQRRQQRQNAVGIRALLRASIGDRSGAEADVAAVAASEDSPPQALARAALAQAILLERSGDREALRAHLERERTLLSDATDPRERAIVRAYQRMLKVRAASVYRKGAPRDAATGEEPSLSDWMEKIAPGAAPFARRSPSGRAAEAGVTEPAPVVTEKARQKVLAARASAARGVKRSRVPAVAAAALFTGVIAAAYALFSTSEPSAPADELVAPGRDLPLAQILVLVIGAAVAIRVVRALGQRKQLRRLQAAITMVFRGRLEDADHALDALTRGTTPIIAAQAWLARASLAERGGDVEQMLARCDAGLGLLSRYATRVAASDVLLPTLVAERAFALAVLDRQDEADAEIAALREEYPFLARARFRVRLVGLVRGGELEAARRLVEGRAVDLPLGPRDELLADAVRAAIAPEAAGSGEVERLREELRVDLAAHRWLERIAPDVVVRLTSAPAEAESDVDARAEQEAGAAEVEEAEEEAAVADRPRPRLA